MTTHEEATMSKYTAEDFERATLATRGDYGVARRTDPRHTHQWYAYGDGQGWFSDEEMAAGGWVPVVESRHVEARAERKRRKLITHIASVEAALRDRNRVIAELRHDLAVARKGREPWSDLADVLRGTVWERLSGDVDGLAAAVHAAGWRKAGDDDE